MQRIKVNASFERQLLIGMIVSTPFLSSIKPIYKNEYIKNNLVKEIAGWCLDYFNAYEKAPQKNIESIFEAKDHNGELDEKMLSFISNILDSLSKEWSHVKKFNVEYLLDQSEKEFNIRKAENLKQAIGDKLLNKDIAEISNLINDYIPVSKNLIDGINPFNSKEAVKRAFTEQQEPLFKISGKFGRLINRQLYRGGFMAFLGAEKSGKSYTLLDIALQAHRQGNNVAFFECGDMTESERLERLLGHVAQRPTDSSVTNILYPIADCILNQNNSCDKRERESTMGLPDINFKRERPELIRIIRRIDKSGYVPCTHCKGTYDFKGTAWYEHRQVKPLTWIEAYRAGKRWDKKTQHNFKLSTHSSDSISVKQIRDKLNMWSRLYGFVPDVVVIDYPDILAPEDSSKSERGIENDRWKAIRKLTQELHALGIVVTQADAGAYGKDSLDRTNFSEDKRKNAHVTSFYSINQTEEEELKGIIRIGEMFVRGQRRRQRKVRVIQCLDIHKPHVMSF